MDNNIFDCLNDEYQKDKKYILKDESKLFDKIGNENKLNSYVESIIKVNIDNYVKKGTMFTYEQIEDIIGDGFLYYLHTRDINNKFDEQMKYLESMMDKPDDIKYNDEKYKMYVGYLKRTLFSGVRKSYGNTLGFIAPQYEKVDGKHLRKEVLDKERELGRSLTPEEKKEVLKPVKKFDTYSIDENMEETYGFSDSFEMDRIDINNIYLEFRNIITIVLATEPDIDIQDVISGNIPRKKLRNLKSKIISFTENQDKKFRGCSFDDAQVMFDIICMYAKKNKGEDRFFKTELFKKFVEAVNNK